MELHFAVKQRLGQDYRRIPPPSNHGRGAHLEVWESPVGKPVGVELHAGSIGFWIKKQHLAGLEIPEGIKRVEKEPKGQRWIGIGLDMRGANSNLPGYPQFVGAKITHLTTAESDAALFILQAIAKARAV